MINDCTTCKHRYTDMPNQWCSKCCVITYTNLNMWEPHYPDTQAAPAALPSVNRLWHYMDQQNIPVPVRYRIIELAQGKE